MKSLCINGHLRIPENVAKNRSCKECNKARVKAYEATSERKATRKIYTATPKRKAATKLSGLKKTGWTLEMLSTTLREQGNACALCRKAFTSDNPPYADHKHSAPPEPRGLLHSTCNSGLGMFQDSPDICRSAAEYLEAWT
jgi:hypothetical protein